MKKFDSKAWAEAKENTGFKRLTPGGYVCAIKSVVDVPEKEYLKMEIDIVKGEDKGYFTKQYESDTRENKKWANAGTLYRSHKESAIGMFKGFITAVEESNKGYTWDWDEKSLKNKYIGIIIGDEEYINSQGKKRVRNHIVAVRSVETIESGDFEIPELKTVDETTVVSYRTDNEVDPFANSVSSDTPFDTDDDPFAGL